MKTVPPLFIVGLPRSGSTLLSKILNDGKTYFSINDLYYVQAVQAVGATKEFLSSEEVRMLTDKLLEVVETRALKNNSFIGQFSFSSQQIAETRQATLEQHVVTPYTWSSLLDDVLTRLARHLNKTNWADKTPQNFMHLDMLRKAFPESKILFLFRDPRNTIVSLKYASGLGHDPRRYHPVLYALYWRTAVRSYLEVRDTMSDVYMVLYEDILDNREETRAKLNEWVDAKIESVEVDSGHNSSFDTKKKKTLNETERWICQSICRREMNILGYTETAARPRLSDLPEFLYTSCRFVVFQTHRVLFSTDGRKRIMSLASRIISKNKRGN